MVEIMAGLIVAGMVIYGSRVWSIESWSYSLSLITLPLFYMLFGLFSETENTILMEFYYGIPYFAVAIFMLFRNFRWSVYVVASLWILHAFYDLFHDSLFINTGVFSWYPHFCAAVDFCIGVYLFGFSRSFRKPYVS